MQKGWLNVMNLLIDTNVILNMVFKRFEFDDAVQLFRKIKESNNNAFITASTVADLFYIIRKKCTIRTRPMLLWTIYSSWLGF